jgi:hypothetical protein
MLKLRPHTSALSFRLARCAPKCAAVSQPSDCLLALDQMPANTAKTVQCLAATLMLTCNLSSQLKPVLQNVTCTQFHPSSAAANSCSTKLIRILPQH